MKTNTTHLSVPLYRPGCLPVLQMGPAMQKSEFGADLQQGDGVVDGLADRRLHGLAQEPRDAARLLGRLQQLHLQRRSASINRDARMANSLLACLGEYRLAYGDHERKAGQNQPGSGNQV